MRTNAYNISYCGLQRVHNAIITSFWRQNYVAIRQAINGIDIDGLQMPHFFKYVLLIGFNRSFIVVGQVTQWPFTPRGRGPGLGTGTFMMMSSNGNIFRVAGPLHG